MGAAAVMNLPRELQAREVSFASPCRRAQTRRGAVEIVKVGGRVVGEIRDVHGSGFYYQPRRHPMDRGPRCSTVGEVVDYLLRGCSR